LVGVAAAIVNGLAAVLVGRLVRVRVRVRGRVRVGGRVRVRGRARVR
jgi:hypothetical protein